MKGKRFRLPLRLWIIFGLWSRLEKWFYDSGWTPYELYQDFRFDWKMWDMKKIKFITHAKDTADYEEVFVF